MVQPRSSTSSWGPRDFLRLKGLEVPQPLPAIMKLQTTFRSRIIRVAITAGQKQIIAVIVFFFIITATSAFYDFERRKLDRLWKKTQLKTIQAVTINLKNLVGKIRRPLFLGWRNFGVSLLAKFPVFLSNHVGFTPWLLYTHQKVFPNSQLKTG